MYKSLVDLGTLCAILLIELTSRLDLTEILRPYRLVRKVLL